MYAKVRLSDYVVVDWMYTLPTDIAGLAQESLDDLGAALKPCPSRWRGFGLWPLMDANQKVPWWKFRDRDNPRYSVDAKARVVTQTHKLSYVLLEHRKEEAKIRCKADCATRVEQGFQHGANLFQIDEDAQMAMTSVMADFNAGTKNAHGGFWRSADNVNVSMTDAECIAFMKAAKAHKMSVLRKMWADIAEIDAADSHAAMDAL